MKSSSSNSNSNKRGPKTRANDANPRKIKKKTSVLITEKIHRIGENIQVGSFTRFEI